MARDRQGDHTGRFIMPGGRRAFGTISLASNKPPLASMRPDEDTKIGPHGRGFPQDSVAGMLVGHLDSNEEVILGDVHLSEWFLDRVSASARWALVGMSVTQVSDCRWSSLEVHMTGLECVLGRAFAEFSWPSRRDTRPLRYVADLDPDAEFVSTHEEITATAKYVPATRIGDPYRFSISNYANVVLVSTTSLTVDGWLRDWVDPLASLITLATGEREEINRLTLTAPEPTSSEDDDEVSHQISGQLFGAGIHQVDQPAERRSRGDGTPIVPLFTLDQAPPLATLVRTWKRSLGDETAPYLYRLAINPTLPSQVRYLLCAQALEALDTSSHLEEEERDDAAHAENRDAVIDAVRDQGVHQLDRSALRFIRDNLSRRPHRPLAGRLSRLIREIPGHAELEPSWTRSTETLGTILESSGRPSTPLHERLAATRNALSHGIALPVDAISPANSILEVLLRGQLLSNLGFTNDQLATAYRRMTMN